MNSFFLYSYGVPKNIMFHKKSVEKDEKQIATERHNWRYEITSCRECRRCRLGQGKMELRD